MSDIKGQWLSSHIYEVGDPAPVAFGKEAHLTFLASLVSVWDRDHFYSDSIVIAPGDTVIFGIIYLNTLTQLNQKNLFFFLKTFL